MKTLPFLPTGVTPSEGVQWKIYKNIINKTFQNSEWVGEQEAD